jgi:hypothetical protein
MAAGLNTNRFASSSFSSSEEDEEDAPEAPTTTVRLHFLLCRH